MEPNPAMIFDLLNGHQRTAALKAAIESLVMLASTAHDEAHTFTQFDEMFWSAGFQSSEMHQFPSLPEQIIVSYK